MSETNIVIGFDLDGPLIDSLDAHWQGVNAVMNFYKKPALTKKELLSKTPLSYEELYYNAGIRDAYEKLRAIYIPVFKKAIEKNPPNLFFDARESLRYLEDVARLYLVTNNDRESVDFYNSYANFLDFFYEVLVVLGGASKYEFLKYIKDKETFGGKINKKFIFITDTPGDLIAAQEAGWLVYGIPRGYASKRILKKVIKKGRGDIIKDLFELRDMFLPEQNFMDLI